MHRSSTRSGWTRRVPACFFPPLFALCALNAAAAAELPLPNPNLASVRPEARTAIEAARKAVDEKRSAPDAERAEAVGRLGMMFLAERLLDAAEPCFRNAQELQPDQLRWSYFLAVVQQRKGDLQGAAQNLRTALRAREGNLPAALRLGNLLLETKAYPEAEGLFRAALPNQLGAAAGHAGLGKIALAQGDARRAIQELEEALKLQPQATALHRPLAQAYTAVGDAAAAKRHQGLVGDQEVAWPDPLISQLDLLVSGAQVARASNDPKIEGLRRALAANPADIETRRSLAGSLVQSGDLEAAQAEYEALVARAPNDARGWLELGSVKADRQRNAQAGIADLRKAVELDPKLRDAHQRLAHMLASTGKFADAVPYLKKAIELDPSMTVARLNLARYYLALEKFDDAQQAVDQLLQREPANFDALLMRGRVLAGANKPDDARKAFQRVADSGSATPGQRAEARYNLGLMAQASNDVPGAIAEYTKALELDPLHLNSLGRLAPLEGQTGDLENAITHFRRLVERTPDTVEHRYRLAALLTRIGDRQGALEHYNVLYASNPEAPEFAVSSAMLMSELGQGAQAITRLEKALAAVKETELKQRILAAIAFAQGKLGQQEQSLATLRKGLAMGESPDLRLELARSMAGYKRWNESLAEFERYLKARPKDDSAHYERAMALVMAGRFADARDRLVEITKTSTDLGLTHLLARILASAPDPKVRNGERAVQIAGTVFTRARNPVHGETLALALAAAGRFPDAVALQKRLLAEAEQAKFEPRFIERVKRNLALFEKNQVGATDW